MNIQFFIVLLMIAAAVAFAVRSLMKKRRSFSPKSGCGSDCGCNGTSK